MQSQDSSGYIIDQGTGFTITMNTMGTLSSVASAMTNLTNGALTTYTITFATLIPVSSGDIFYITFPAEVVLTSNSILSCGASSNINSLSCSASGQDLQVKLSTVSGSTGNFAFTVKNVYNPYSTKSSSTYTNMYILDSSGYSVAKYTGSVIVTTTTPANILTYYLTQQSIVSLAVTDYVISFTPTNPIATAGSILLIWPVEVSVAATSGCYVTTTSKFSSNCAIKQSTRTITITGVFSAATSYYY